MKAIILVAGYATRLYPLTKDRPKPLLPVGNKPMINYILEQIETIDCVDEIYLISNHKFASHFGEWAKNVKSSKPISVLDDGTSDEHTRLGAIGDINFTINQKNINDDLLIICGDNLFTYKLKDYVNYFNSVGTDCVCAKELDDIEMLKAFAVATVDGSDKVIDLVEKPDEPKSNLAVYGTYIYTKETVPLFKQYLAEGNKPDAPGYFVQWLYTRKAVHAYKMNGECYDIGTHKAYEEINRIIKDMKF